MKETKIDFKIISMEWLKIKRISIKYSTYVKYKQIILTHLIPYFEKIEIKDIDEVLIAKFFFELSNDKKLSSSTIQTIKNILKSIYSYGEQKYKFDYVNFSIVKIQNPKKKIKVLSKEEENALSTYCLCNMNSTTIAILLGLYAGLRIGEICALQWCDIDFKNETITIAKTVQRLENEEESKLKTKLFLLSPKTMSSNRYVIIPKFLNQFLINYSTSLDIKEDKQSYYLVSNSLDTIEPRTIQRRFEKICRDLGFKVNFHVLRHTYATNCIKLGIDVKTVSEMLGHSNISTTLNRYVHPSMEYKKEQINKFQFP